MYTFATTPVPDFLSVEQIVSVQRTVRTSPPKEAALPNAGESHRFWGFLYLEQGDIHILVDDTVLHPKPGQLILYPPFCTHSVAASREAVINVVFFETHSGALEGIAGRVLQLSPAQQKALSELMSLGLSLFTKAPSSLYGRGNVPRQEATSHQLKKFAVLLELFLMELCEQDVSGADPVSQGAYTGNYQAQQFRSLMEYLKGNLNRVLTLEQISAACALSPSQLHRICTKFSGCAPLAYFTALKISTAKRLIRESSMNFTQIAQQLGFSSVHYFSRLFKAKTGMTPSQYAAACGQPPQSANGWDSE